MSSRAQTSTSALPPSTTSSSGGTFHKANVLASVQDAYWSDDETEDSECPLCLEEMDLSDMNFKPCPCGYQICRFCWHHIKTNLNKRCPACRREYTEDAVEFKPVGKEDQKRLAQQRRHKEKERKELDALGRRHLTNVRIVQRNMIYVTGIGPRFAKEELVPTLRSNEYFGQYGKITKILLVKRPPPAGSPSRQPQVGLYINYYRREDAARAIVAVDGAPSPSGGGEVMRASHGTTKYCTNFLRGLPCTSQGCLDMHDWGDERDCFTKEDLATLSVQRADKPAPASQKLMPARSRKHTIKDSEHRPRPLGAQATRKSDEIDLKSDAAASSRVPNKPPLEVPALPRTASWARPSQNARPASPMNAGPPPGLQQQPQSQAQPRSSRQAGRPREQVAQSRASPAQDSSRNRSNAAPTVERRAAQPASARVATETTPPSVGPDVPPGREGQQAPKVAAAPPAALSSSAPGPSAGHATKASISAQPSRPAFPSPPVPAAPSRTPAQDSTAVSAGIVASTSSYRLTNQARALLDDVLNLRETAPTNLHSPFPDFDRTLMNLQGGGFSFSLDFNPSITGGGSSHNEADSQNGKDVWSTPTSPSATSFGITPLSIPVPELERIKTPGYSGSFNPFDPPTEDRSDSQGPTVPSTREQSPTDGDELRRSSRFDFARRHGTSSRLGPSVSSSPKLSEGITTSSPAHSSSILSPPHQQQVLQSAGPSSWSYSEFSQGHGSQGPSLSNPQAPQNFQSPSEPPMFHQYSQDSYPHHQQELNNAMLQKMLNIGGQSSNTLAQGHMMHNAHPYDNQPFHDPAIMSVESMPPAGLYGRQELSQVRTAPGPLSGGPPPGLGGPPPHYAIGPPMTYGSSSHSFRVGIGGSDPSSPHAGAPSPSYNSAMSTSAHSGDAEGVSASGEGEQANTESVVDSGQVSAAISRPPSPALSASDFPPLSAVDFPSLPASQPVEGPARREVRRPTIPPPAVRSVEARPAQVQRKPVTVKKVAPSLPKKVVQPIAAAAASSSEKPQSVPIIRAPQPSKVIEVSDARSVTSPTISSAPQGASKPPARPSPHPATVVPAAPVQYAPFLSKKARKVKPAGTIEKRSSRDEATQADEPDTPEVDEAADEPAEDSAPAPPPAAEVAQLDVTLPPYTERLSGVPATLGKLLNEIGRYMDVESLAFFDTTTVSSKSQTPIRYAPLVHALSTLSAGGGSFASNMPNGSIDSAVSSFQQLLETLTQTISDILHLLPRNTWDDSSSFDGVLRDMLKAEDLLDEMADEAGVVRDDEVAQLTVALEKRARWMEVQLAKLEELHRDINTAAVRAVLSINDRGWDSTAFLPRQGDSLGKFDILGQVEVDGENQYMTIEELESSLEDAKVKESMAEAELKQCMHRNCAHLWSA